MAPPQAPRANRTTVRVGVVVGIVAVMGFAFTRLDLRPTLGHVRVAVLSGTPEGNYHALVDELGRAVAKRGGTVKNVASGGSGENLGRLAAAEGTCEVGFALTQGGMPLPPSDHLTLVGRLAKSESVLFLGKDADRIHDFAALKGLRVGIGPEGSGTAQVAREVLEAPEFAPLGVTLSHHALAAQLDLAAQGALDLAVFVMDEDAAFVSGAVRDKGLQIAGFPHADVVARRHPHLGTGRIGAGQYDAVRMLPPEDKRVLRVDTLVVANGCARRSQTLGLLAALADVFPDFVRHNRETPNTSGLELDRASRGFFEHQGPELVDEYLPRAGDVMPPSNWAYLVMGISVLFNLMGLANRFVLWRIDAARVRAEADLQAALGARALSDLERLDPRDHPSALAGVARVVDDLERLVARCRRLSLSPLVPMGGEMAYRYQEALMLETLGALHAYQARAAAPG